MQKGDLDFSKQQGVQLLCRVKTESQLCFSSHQQVQYSVAYVPQYCSHCKLLQSLWRDHVRVAPYLLDSALELTIRVRIQEGGRRRYAQSMITSTLGRGLQRPMACSCTSGAHTNMANPPVTANLKSKLSNDCPRAVGLFFESTGMHRNKRCATNCSAVTSAGNGLVPITTATILDVPTHEKLQPCTPSRVPACT